MPHWNVQRDCLEIENMPFYWRLSESPNQVAGIESKLPIRVTAHPENGYLHFVPNAREWGIIDTAYRQNANIGFVNPESGQLATYGSSVNNFFLEVIRERKPKHIFEIGCGAGFTIRYLQDNGFDVTGIDPSDYSARWSEQLGFALINGFFDSNTIGAKADLIYCNDVFEHIPNVEAFSRDVFNSLKDGGAFCIATTNSHRSIELGDISMLEHQHVNMFTTHSINLILRSAGFTGIFIKKGSYGNTFHIVAVKAGATTALDDSPDVCAGFFDRATMRLEAFDRFYRRCQDQCGFYVPLRCMPYLSSVGDFGDSDIYDSNAAWRGKFFDGYDRPIKSLQDIVYREGSVFFVGSLTFHDEIKKALIQKGYPSDSVFSILDV